MIEKIERRSYNYYRKAQVQKIVQSTKRERILRLQSFN